MIGLGRRVYGLGAIALGLVALAYGGFSPDWLPVSPHISGYRILAYACGGLLVLAGAAINVRRFALAAALTLAAVFALTMAAFEASHVVAKPADWSGWQAIAESAAMAMGGLLAFAQVSAVAPSRAAAIARIARLAFGLCLLVFGGSHFVYARLTASLVPAWLPPSQLFWACATGAAQIAAGLAVITGIRARLAAILLTILYVVFGALVHIPSIAADPTSQANWTENAINLVLVGAAWALAELLSKPMTRRARASAPS